MLSIVSVTALLVYIKNFQPSVLALGYVNDGCVVNCSPTTSVRKPSS